MGIHVLGPLTVDDGPRLSRRDRIVLSALVLERPRPVSLDRLVELMWPDGPPPTSTKVIQGCVARLRGLVDHVGITTTEQGYRLDRVAELDAATFEAGVARGRQLLTLGQPDRAAHALGEVLELWRGRPFPELEHWDVAAIETARLQELRSQAEELHLDALLAAGRAEDAVTEASRLVDLEPLREHRWVQLALAQVRCGRQAEALASLARCRDVLREELGLDPGPTVEDLQAAILRQDPGLVAANPLPAESGTCPWPGLESYDASRADGYRGRAAEIRSALAVLRGRGVLVVVGPSGVGKSSFALAGLTPVLQREGRHVSVTTPGPVPVAPTGADVLVVDQCEEVFGPEVGRERADAFLAALVEHARAGSLVVCLRADRMTEVAEHPALARLVERGLFLLPPMGPEGLRAAVEEPAAAAGLVVEPGLVEVLLRDLEGEPGALPLLSHALLSTWQRREGRTLTVDGYRASGGVRRAVAQTAEEVHSRLTDDQRIDLRALMLRLVSSGTDGEPLRARVPRQLIDRDPVRHTLVETMVGSRLLTADEGMVTLAHEALVRAWPRLRGWIEDDAEGRRILQHLASSAQAWDALGRPDSELYRGVRLARALDWQEKSAVDLAPSEREFLRASTERAQDEERSALEQVRRQRRANRQLRLLVAGLAIMLVGAIVAGGAALHQSQAARRAALSADARRLAAAALTQEDPAQALMTALAAERLDPSVDTEANLQAVLAKHPQLIRSTQLPVASTLSRVLGTTAGLIVTDRTHTLHRVDARTLASRATAQAGGTEGDVWDVPVAYSQPRDSLAVASQQPDRLPVRLLDPRTLRMSAGQLRGWPRRQVGVMSLAFSGDGRYLAAAMATSHVVSQVDGQIDSGRVQVWDLRTRRVVRTIPLQPNYYVGVALDRTGRRLFLTNPLTAYDVRSGRRLWRGSVTDYRIAASVQPHGGLLATVTPSDATRVDLRDPRTGRVVRTLDGHEHDIDWVTFSHDGTRVAASGEDGLALVWDAATGELVDRIEVGGEQVTGLTFSPDDRTLTTVSEPGHQISSWDLSGRRTFITQLPVSHPSVVTGGNARVSHDGTRVATVDQQDSGPLFRIVDVARDTNVGIRTPPSAQSLGAMAWSPDDSRFALGFDRGVVEVADGHTGRDLAHRRVLSGMLTEVSYSTDGRYLVAADIRGNVVRLDPRTLKRTGVAVRIPENPYAVTASPDGRFGFLIAGGTQWRPYWEVPIDRFYLVDLTTGRIVSKGPAGVHNAVYADYSPDGRHVTVAGHNGEIAVLDLPSGRPAGPRIDAYSGNSFSVRYDASGARVTTASTTAEMALLDGRTGELLATAALPTVEGVTVSNFAPDGTIVLATFRGNVFRWDPSTSHAVSFACSVTGRGLSRREWQVSVPQQPWRDSCPG